jgi:GNAT superfamily N-acetyltransferase
MAITIALCDPLPEDAFRLAEAAEEEGHSHIRRFVDEWVAGSNRFDREGERMLVARAGDALVGVGGLTLEFSRRDWLRMRRFYVLPAYRGQGIGRRLAQDLLGHARAFTGVVTVHAANDEAILFWQAMGFRPLRRESYTHILEFA